MLRLRPLNGALRAAVERQASEAARLDRPDLMPYCISNKQVRRQLLDRVDTLSVGGARATPFVASGEDRMAERGLRERALVAGFALPLDEPKAHAELASDEQQALLLCVAPDLDRAYERIFAFVLNDLNRRFACTELLCVVIAGATADRLACRHLLVRGGRLRRFGLLRQRGDAATQLRQVLPLERRHADLRDHGPHADAHRVPLLRGRVIELSGR
jgi:hypothetical protein